MIYIYDLILNWCRDKKYEFFEWKENDEIEYIKTFDPVTQKSIINTEQCNIFPINELLYEYN